MVPIRNIGNLPTEFRRTERNQKQNQIDSAAEGNLKAQKLGDKAVAGPKDQVNLSESARTLLQRDAEIQRYTAEMPFIETLSADEKRVIEARIASGFYTSPEMDQQVAGKIAEESKPADTSVASKGLSPTRFQEVIENIRTNQYDSQDVLGVIADRILKDL